MKLSQPMLDNLERIDELKTRHGACGMFPRGPGQWATMKAMERRGSFATSATAGTSTAA